MYEVFGIALGVVVTSVVGALSVKHSFKRIKEGLLKQFGGQIPVPRGVPRGVWEREVPGRTSGGETLGFAERLIVLGVLWIPSAWPVIAAWLAFKVASKWNSWSQLGDMPKLPESFLKEYGEPLENLRARACLFAWGNRRFVTGTALSLLAALFGLAAGKALVFGLCGGFLR